MNTTVIILLTAWGNILTCSVHTNNDVTASNVSENAIKETERFSMKERFLRHKILGGTRNGSDF